MRSYVCRYFVVFDLNSPTTSNETNFFALLVSVKHRRPFCFDILHLALCVCVADRATDPLDVERVFVIVALFFAKLRCGVAAETLTRRRPIQTESKHVSFRAFVQVSSRVWQGSQARTLC